MADNSRVVEIKVETVAAINAIDKMTKKIDELKAEEQAIKKVAKESGELTDTNRKRLVAINEEQKAYKKQIQVVSKEVQNNIKIYHEQEGSLKQLRAQLSNLTAEYDALSKAERESATGQELKNKINEVTNELKGAEEETQRYYRNVGNYAGSLGSIIANQVPQAQNLTMVWNNIGNVVVDARKQMAVAVTTFNAATTATARLTAGFKMLKIAIVSTGIGAIVVGLGSLVSYLTRTQKGVELARTSMAGISATIDVLLDRLAMLGSSIVSLFKGDFVDAANTAKAAFQGIGKEIREETNTAMALSDAMQDIEKREIALSAQMAASKVQLAELKRIADDTTRSYKEREDAAQQALNIEVGLAAKAKQIGQERIANMLGDASKLEKALSYLSQGKGSDWIIDNLGLSASTVKDYEGLVDAFNAYQQQVLEFTEKQVEGNNKLNSIRKERIATEKAAMEEMLAIEKELDDEIAKMGDAYQKQIEREWQLRLETIVKGSEEEFNIRAEELRRQREMQLAEEGTTYEMRKLIWEKYNQDMRALQSGRDAQEMEQMRLTWSNKIAEAQLQGQNTLQLELERRKAELDALHQMEGENEAQFLARQLEAKQAYADAQKKISDFEVTVEQTKAEAIANITNGLGQIFEAFAEDNKAMAMASKVLALAEIAINTGKAIAAGVASASGVPFPGNIAAIGSTVATVLANIATATKTIKAAKFAEGGYVTGAGTTTSDDVPAWLSNHESVNNAISTAMFSPLYSALNQMGGGAPIIPRSASEVGSITEGEEMLARAVAKGVSALHPVVSVEEINRVSDRVAFVKTLGDV